MTDLPRLTSTDDLESAMVESGRRPVLFFKHSLTCGVSSWALREVEKVVAARGDDTTVRVVEVQRSRELSRELSRRTGIDHASPQAILVHDGRAVWHESHWNLEGPRIARALDTFSSGDAAEPTPLR